MLSRRNHWVTSKYYRICLFLLGVLGYILSSQNWDIFKVHITLASLRLFTMFYFLNKTHHMYDTVFIHKWCAVHQIEKT